MHLLYVSACAFTCAELGVCGPSGVSHCSCMYASNMVVRLHVLYGAYRCMVRKGAYSFQSGHVLCTRCVVGCGVVDIVGSSVYLLHFGI